MKYEIMNTAISGIEVSVDKSLIQFNITIRYRALDAEKTDLSVIGCSITLSLASGDRSTMLDELNDSILAWFEANYNV